MPTRAGQVLNQNLNRNELAKESMKSQYNRVGAGVQENLCGVVALFWRYASG